MRACIEMAGQIIVVPMVTHFECCDCGGLPGLAVHLFGDKSLYLPYGAEGLVDEARADLEIAINEFYKLYRRAYEKNM